MRVETRNFDSLFLRNKASPFIVLNMGIYYKKNEIFGHQ